MSKKQQEIVCRKHFYFFGNGDLAKHLWLLVFYYEFPGTVQKGRGGTKMASIYSQYPGAVNKITVLSSVSNTLKGISG